MPESWRQLYQSDLQGVWAVWIVPALFLLYLGRTWHRPGPSVEPRAAGFMRAYALVFAVETMLDPFAGGPLLRWLGLADGALATSVMVAFVLLGDFRVFLLVLFLAAPETRVLRRVASEAALWTLVVPVVAVAGEAVLRALAGDLPSQSIWLVYELAFLAMALVLRGVVVPARMARIAPQRSRLRAYLGAVTAYVAVYYALWAVADVLIMVGGFDAGWALRIVPNQLYYAFYVPLVYGLFFSRRYASTSTATQASR
jgi:hypothetical protein